MKEKEFTRFEKARIIGARALQLATGAAPLIKSKEKNPIDIAKQEFDKGVIPLDVRRKAPVKLRKS